MRRVMLAVALTVGASLSGTARADASHGAPAPGTPGANSLGPLTKKDASHTLSGTTTTTNAYVTQPNFVASPPPERDAADSEKKRFHAPLLYTGLTFVLAPYVASVIVAAQSPRDEDKKLFIPVAGPWLDLSQRPCTFGDCGRSEKTAAGLLVGSGVAQGLGVLFVLLSAAFPEEGTADAQAPTQGTHVTFMPLLDRTSAGVGAAARF